MTVNHQLSLPPLLATVSARSHTGSLKDQHSAIVRADLAAGKQTMPKQLCTGRYAAQDACPALPCSVSCPCMPSHSAVQDNTYAFVPLAPHNAHPVNLRSLFILSAHLKTCALYWDLAQISGD